MLPLDREPGVTTRPVAHPFRKIFAVMCWALTLARSRHANGGRRPFPPTLSITLILPTTMRPTALTGPITPARLHPSPTPRRLNASLAAIATLRARRSKPTLTTLQQTTTVSTRTPTLLSQPPDMIQWIWAPGRSCSRRSSLGAKRQLGSEAPSHPRLEVLPTYHRSRDPTPAPRPEPLRDSGPMLKRW